MLIHTRLIFAAATAWIKIWYLARGLDLNGSGWAQVPVEEMLQLTDRKLSTIYRWLREAQSAGAIRSWRVKDGVFRMYYTSLPKLCLQLGLDDWGTAARVPLESIPEIETVACEVETQFQQEISQFAATKALPKQERKVLKLHPVEDLVDRENEPNLTIEWSRGASATGVTQSGQSSLQAPTIHRGSKRVFVDSQFIPFGASQVTIASALGVSDRTVRRHQVSIPKKQLVQTKPAYKVMAEAFRYGQICVGGDPETYLSEMADGTLRLYERAGASSATQRLGGQPVTADRFSPEYFGVPWFYRCNLYSLSHELTSMRVARRRFQRFKKLMEKCRQKATAAGGVAHK